MDFIIHNLQKKPYCICYEDKYYGECCPFLDELDGMFICRVLNETVKFPYTRCEAEEKGVIEVVE